MHVYWPSARFSVHTRVLYLLYSVLDLLYLSGVLSIMARLSVRILCTLDETPFAVLTVRILRSLIQVLEMADVVPLDVISLKCSLARMCAGIQSRVVGSQEDINHQVPPGS